MNGYRLIAAESGQEFAFIPLDCIASYLALTERSRWQRAGRHYVAANGDQLLLTFDV